MSFAELVKDELSGSIAKSFVAQISQFHRIQGSPMFHEAAEYIKTELGKLGLEDIVIERFPADGKTKYWTYTSPIGWEIKNAELRMVNPKKQLMCTYEDCPQSLHTFSSGTPDDGVTAELVDVGTGIKPEDYKNKNVMGKFVLATGRSKLVHEQAVYKYGAAGVITDAITYEMPNVRESIDVPDAHAYQAIWPAAENLSKVKFGFSLSKRQGNALRALLKSGKSVKLKATVNARFFPFYEDVVTAVVRGKEKHEEEVFLVAHLCHPKPSANDNASGSGLLLEIARTIKTLIDKNKIRPPRRTIRFIWVPETLGTIAHISNHPELGSKLVAGVNLDMVGQNQELCRSSLCLDRTPDSLPSFLNDFVFNLMEQTVREFDAQTPLGSASTFRYRSQAFSGGSDHAEFTESTTKVPCVMLLQWPDLFYHTSMDTIDKVSEDSLKRVGWIVTMAVLNLANASAKEAFECSHQSFSKGLIRIAEASHEAIQALFETHDAKQLARTYRYHRNKIEHVLWRESNAVKSVKRLAENPELDAHIDRYLRQIEDFGKNRIAEIDDALGLTKKALNMATLAIEETLVKKETKRLIPKKLFKGTLNADLLRQTMTEKEYEWYEKIEEKDKDFDKKIAEILNFIDGSRTIHEIIKMVSSEYSLIDPEDVMKFVKDLKKAKLVSFK